ncbi:hypothetical protein BD414DRAFT_278394 [Trametes punicea]|nr:hypothetical protein BD414DRAFT_278394 [Trametes punicea]
MRLEFTYSGLTGLLRPSLANIVFLAPSGPTSRLQYVLQGSIRRRLEPVPIHHRPLPLLLSDLRERQQRPRAEPLPLINSISCDHSCASSDHKPKSSWILPQSRSSSDTHSNSTKSSRCAGRSGRCTCLRAATHPHDMDASLQLLRERLDVCPKLHTEPAQVLVMARNPDRTRMPTSPAIPAMDTS